MVIREATKKDYHKVWEIFSQVVRKGDTYVFDPNTTIDGMAKCWFTSDMTTFVAELDGKIVGTYMIRPNQKSLGKHIANCGYMVHLDFMGKGIGKEMCLHSLELAKSLGYIGMQFNMVVSTNKGAIKLWEKLGFKIVGVISKGFNHKEFGYVDALIMFKEL